MHPHFAPPQIHGAKNFREYVTTLKIWWAFHALREAGQNE